MKLEDCLVRPSLAVLGGKWKAVIIYHLLDGPRRYGELRKLIPDSTQKMMTQQLRELEADGLVSRHVYHQVPPKVDYDLTELGMTLRPVMEVLCRWGKSYTSAKSRALRKQQRNLLQ